MKRQETFDRLVWSLVQAEREKTMVVDNLHAYAIIKDRVDSFWEQVRLMQPDDEQIMVLGGLVAIAAYAQLAAENLAFTPEQKGVDESADDAQQAAHDAKTMLHRFVNALDFNKRRISPLQKGVERYVFEFDESLLNTLVSQIESLK
jgi:hypothetical protein